MLTARSRRTALAVVAAAGLFGTVAVPTAAQAADANARHHKTVNLQLLAINDFHGNLEPPAGSAGTIKEIDPATGKEVSTPAGGIEYLATALRQAREAADDSITVAAGDIVGASPLTSALFHDEPTIEAMDKLGLDVTSVGNHEFDHGSQELLRLQNGGCHPVDGCYEKGRKFRGANFNYLSANVTDENTGEPLLAPYWVTKSQGVKIGFIGVTLEGTPNVVTAAGVKGLKFANEVTTINKYAAELKAQGVNSIVALIHEGGYPASSVYNYDCGPAGQGVSGPIVDISRKLDPSIGAIVTGHTHNSYACTIPDPNGVPRSVTSAASFGRLFTQIDLKLDKSNGTIVRPSVKAENHVVRRTLPKAEDMSELIARYSKLAAPIANRPVGYIASDINGRGSSDLEKPLGDLIADAQLEGLSPADKGGAQVAFMNPGGIRSDLVYKAVGSEGDGVVTYSKAFTVQPFTNMMQVKTLTGAQLIQLLQQQVSGGNTAAPKILQVSKSLSYTLDMRKTGADRVLVDSIRLNGAPIDPAAKYRVAANEFLAAGGDGFPAFAAGTDKLVGASDLEVFVAYLGAHSSASAPLKAPAKDRIKVIGPGIDID
ncbi:bifunctional metallophosphatase/5'-nucleotidase [Streptomyces kaniharaensis]|uniref:Bifunctional metallophosphatase/5'-nucleotidase n=1 Tax=Streptomyces kaniharaensis TaxID=212423 RepID=A0A6N7KQQ5_9ACTN|nr:bifunctional metallophosphatase/5'-nucleotidase [Streptomyces kaniharaensis]MQS12899.1 bifunctional metallophosphatase/5'-nucleotidase [Streptomyces kaniharaensis]